MLPQQQSLLCFTYLNVSLTLLTDKHVVLKMDGNIKVKKAISRIYKSRSSVVLITCPNDQVQVGILIAQLQVLKSSEGFFLFFFLHFCCQSAVKFYILMFAEEKSTNRQ